MVLAACFARRRHGIVDAELANHVKRTCTSHDLERLTADSSSCLLASLISSVVAAARFNPLTFSAGSGALRVYAIPGLVAIACLHH